MTAPARITAFLALMTGTAAAATLHVPTEYATVQEAIDAASAGDEVVLAPGIYAEHFAFTDVDVTVRSAEGAASTVFDGDLISGEWIAYFPSHAIGELRGITIRNNTASYQGAVTIRRSAARIIDCVFEHNENFYGGSARQIDTWTLGDAYDIRVEGCAFRENHSGGGGGAVVVMAHGDDPDSPDQHLARFDDCRFESNTGGEAGHLLILQSTGCVTEFDACDFRQGSGELAHAVVVRHASSTATDMASVSMRGCTLEDHAGPTIRSEHMVTLHIDDAAFRDSGSPSLYLNPPSTAEIAGSTFCGTSTTISGTWTNLGQNEFTDDCLCSGDGNGDGVVDVSDLLAMLAVFGEADPAWDVDGDGIVGVNDLLALIASWGAC